MKLRFLIVTFLALGLLARAQQHLKIQSPKGNIVLTLWATPEAPMYSVSFDGNPVVEASPLGLDFENGDFGKEVVFKNVKRSKGTEAYSLVVGKTSSVKSDYRELSLSLQEQKGLKRNIELQFRLFDDGLGFRYRFPAQKGWENFTLLDENTHFNIPGNPKTYSLYWNEYNNSHEGLYPDLSYAEIAKDTLMDVPSLFAFDNKTYMAITEANLRDYAGMYLSKQEDGTLKSILSPLQGQTKIKVKGTLPHDTPWRVLLLGKRMKTLMESNVITSLSEPCKIPDTSWIHPGKTTFHWWNGDIAPDSTFAPGVNFEFNKYYIDFAAKHHIDYHSVIGYGGFAWYTNDSPGYGEVGPNTDVTKPVASLDMQKVCDYAHAQGVGIHVWVNWKAIYPQLEKAFAQFEKWGINGMMVDFMNRDDQEMVQIQEEILKTAAKHHLFIQFHGSFKPVGLHRTYPNLFTREGSYNYEQNKWSPAPLTAEHDLNMVYIRQLAGAMDYHLGGFRAVPLDDFKIQYTRPLMGGTRCHMLAMYVVLESYLNMVADYPDAYLGQPGFDFLQEVPTTWDKTVVLHDAMGQYVTIARQHGGDWYLGSLNNSEAKEINIPLDFLPKGQYKATLYTDVPEDAKNPNALHKEGKTLDRSGVLKVWMAAGGGQAAVLRPIVE